MNKIILLIFFCTGIFFYGNIFAADVAQETILYEISPFGSSEYQDLGLVELRGSKMNLVIFKTDVAGFKDTEKIYSDPDTFLPLWVERDITMWLRKEYLTEQYFPKANREVISKFENGRKTKEYFFKANGPIHNAILLPFSLRKIQNLGIGWSCNIRLPEEFKVTLVSVENVSVPAGTFRAYHFTSVPAKFEIWITNDSLRLPVKIKGLGALSYTLSMKKRSAPANIQEGS